MQQTPLTTRERTVHEKAPKSSLAIVSVFFVIVLFGLFWLWQRNEMGEAEITVPTYESIDAREKEVFDYSTLEASAVNISIPSFESVL